MSVDCILGVDPGLSGAIAWYFPDTPESVTVEDVPVVASEIDAATLTRRISQLRPTMAVIELVAARPGQGVSSMFKFGKAYGTVIGVVAALSIPVHFTSPQRWKKHFRLDSDKEKSRREAIRLFPSNSASFCRKKDNGRAEAALIARYGAETLIRRSVA